MAASKFQEAWPTIEAWTEDVNNIVSFTIGTGIEDLPDLPTADAYEDQVTPKDFCLEHLGILNGRIVDPDTFRDFMG